MHSSHYSGEDTQICESQRRWEKKNTEKRMYIIQNQYIQITKTLTTTKREKIMQNDPERVISATG